MKDLAKMLGEVEYCLTKDNIDSKQKGELKAMISIANDVLNRHVGEHIKFIRKEVCRDTCKGHCQTDEDILQCGAGSLENIIGVLRNGEQIERVKKW